MALVLKLLVGLLLERLGRVLVLRLKGIVSVSLGGVRKEVPLWSGWGAVITMSLNNLHRLVSSR